MYYNFRQLLKYLFDNKKLKKNTNHKIIKFFIIHMTLILFFAILYYLIDIWMSKHPELAKKYFLTSYALEGNNRKEKSILKEDLLNIKPFFYHLYFSAITQTTLGYGGQTNGRGDNIPILMKNVIFQAVNLIQICSIFVIPLLVIFSKD